MEWFIIACGIEKCIECTEDENGEDECVCCIEGYSPYHNHESISECIPLIEKQTKQLEEMEEEEENERENADLLCELCCNLTCVIVAKPYVGMLLLSYTVFCTLYNIYIATVMLCRIKLLVDVKLICSLPSQPLSNMTTT